MYIQPSHFVEQPNACLRQPNGDRPTAGAPPVHANGSATGRTPDLGSSARTKRAGMADALKAQKKSALYPGIMTALMMSATMSAPALAQQAAPATAEQEITQLDRVSVTGTRLAGGTAAEAAQPVQVISAETFEELGATQLSEVLNLIPALRSSNPRITNAGVAPALDLRGMGTERTLVLVNGRRHVSGIPGTAAVDTSSIPSALVERVEVLTGGASAVYGSDAVTGVVNYILKENYVGTEMSFQGGISEEGDTERFFGSLIHGSNFGPEERGNITLSFQGEKRTELTYGERHWTANNRMEGSIANPELRFQHADGVPLAWVGQTILVSGAPRFADTPQALVDRALNATPLVYAGNRNYAITSQSGLVGWAPNGRTPVGADGFDTLVDLDGNGMHDCAQNGVGRGVQSGGVLGCWIIDPVSGALVPYQDGLFASGAATIGSNGMPYNQNHNFIVPEEKSAGFSLTANYEVAPVFRPYIEAKYVQNRTVAAYNSYYDDYLAIPLDNAFIPAELRAIIDAELAANPALADTAAVTVARDHHDIFGNREHKRETIRTVIGALGDFSNGWNYDISLNYGRTEQESIVPTRLDDRFFAAIDSVVDPATGNIVCRSTLDPTAMPNVSATTPGYPNSLSGFNTFSPGECVPLNYFGWQVASPEALAFQNHMARQETTLEQFVASAILVGDTGDWFSLQGGPIGFVVGAEYREEKSEYVPDVYEQAGYIFQGRSTQVTKGSFDVTEAFLEVGLPILSGHPFAETLSLSGAYRWSDYSTVGTASTWKVDGIWAPFADVRFRAGYSETIRAPNINELYSPRNTASFGLGPTVDPCDMNLINLGTEFREANCRAALGITGAYDYSSPLTSGVLGETGGNENLLAEESTSYTYGVVFQPIDFPGFWASFDYWNIRIKDAIANVTARQIVENCYDAPSLDNPFCDLFTRNMDTSSIYYRGINYLLQTRTNFAGLEASGIDFSLNYRFDVPALGNSTAPGQLSLALSGTYLEARNDYPFPSDPDLADPEKNELNYPEWTFNTNINWQINDKFSVGLFSTYYDRQSIPEIENAYQYPNAFVSPTWSHNASARWRINEKTNVSLGINNLTDRKPYMTSISDPVSAVGRYYFARINYILN